MKLHTSDAPEITMLGGVGDAKDFTLEMNAQAAQMLSSGLYSDARKAIIRELSCNAWDAHIAAGNTGQKFDVQFPGRFSAEFIVRDYGTGLTHEQAMGLYTTYFKSTKNGNGDQEEQLEDELLNKVTGALGLGSKSPLGYTNNYAVISYQDGKARQYAIFIDPETGMPKCQYAGETDTDEPNGLEVRVPTKDNDHWEWKRAAERVYPFFDELPNMADADINIEVPEALGTFGNVTLLRSAYCGYGDWIVKMGNVAYPLDVEKVPEDLQEMLNCSWGMITVPMGEVMFTPDRDSLFYNTKTLENIERHLREFARIHSDTYFQKLEALSSLHEFCEFNREMLKDRIAIYNNDLRLAAMVKGAKIIMELEGTSQYYPILLEALNDKVPPKNTKELAERFRQALLKLLGEENVNSWYSTRTFKIHRGVLAAINPTAVTLNMALEVDAYCDANGSRLNEYSWAYTRGGRRKGKLDPLIIGNYSSQGFERLYLVANDTDERVTLMYRKWVAETKLTDESSLIIFVNDSDKIEAHEQYLKEKGIKFERFNVSDCGILDFKKEKAARRSESMVIVATRNSNRYRTRNENAWGFNRGVSLQSELDSPGAKTAWVEVNGYDPLNSTTIRNNEQLKDFVGYRMNDTYDIQRLVMVKTADVELFKNDPNQIHVDDAVQAVIDKKLEIITDEALIWIGIRDSLDIDQIRFVDFLKRYINKLVNPDLVAQAQFLKDLGLVCPPSSSREVDEAIYEVERCGIEIDIDTKKKEGIEFANKLKKVYNSIPCSGNVINSPDQDGILKIVNTFTEN